ncbi:18S rRNA pseudouridine methyltransferase, partial [Chytridiales sp. JEL 0842]
MATGKGYVDEEAAVTAGSSVWEDHESVRTRPPQAGPPTMPSTSDHRINNEHTPLLSPPYGEIGESEVEEEPGFIGSVRRTYRTLGEKTVSYGEQVSAKVGPVWERSRASAQGAWTGIKQRFHAVKTHVSAEAQGISNYINTHYTVQQKNIGLAGLGITTILFLAYFIAVVVIFNPENQSPPAIPDVPPTEPAPQLPTPPPVEPEPATLCTTAECVITAANLLQSINFEVDPCEDFYEFSCGSWAKAHPIPTEKALVTTMSTMGDRNREIIKRIVESPYPEDDL